MIKSIIFDFDGVIANTNNVKTEAFVKLFDEYPDNIKDAIRKFHLQNGGMSRFDKLRFIYTSIINEPLSEERFRILCSDFRNFVMDGVINAPLFDGVEEFLEANRTRYGLYIVSGTPEEEIREIVGRKKLDKYFSGVYGSPRSKKLLLEYVMSENDYAPQEVIFLGDSINDYEGANAAGVRFVAKLFDNLGVEQFPGVELKLKIRDIKELGRYLDERGEF